MNIKFYKVLICMFVMFLDVANAKAEFKLDVDESRTDYVMVDIQDCSV